MKKIIFIFAAMAVLVSCQKENGPKFKDETYTYSFDASQEEVIGTRTVIDGKVSKWSGKEAIRVIGADNSNYNFETEIQGDPVAAATFQYSGEQELKGFGDEGKTFYAVYPYGSSNLTVNDATQTISGINVPTTQTAVEGSYDVMAPVAVAYSTDGKTLEFKNVTALVKFQVLVEGVNKVTFSGNNSEPLSGNINVSYNNGQPSFVTTETTKTYLELICNDGFKVGTDYYFSILPNDFTQGFKVEINGKRERYLETEKTVARSSILSGIKLGTDVPSIICTENHWAVARGAMTLEGDYYVKKGVKLDNVGFKVVTGWTAGYDKWKTTIESGIQTNCWYNVYWSPSQNATPAIEEGATYDIYLDKDCKSVCVVKSGETMPEKSLANTQLYIVLQQNWEWADRRLHYWYKDGADITTWPGVSPDVQNIEFQNDKTKKNCYWKMSKKEVYGQSIGIIFSNNAKDQTGNYFLEPFDTDHYYYLAWTSEQGNHVVEIPL